MVALEAIQPQASRVKSLKAQVEMLTPVPYQLPFVKKPLPQNSTEACFCTGVDIVFCFHASWQCPLNRVIGFIMLSILCYSIAGDSHL
jgi:hypothetical protein